MSDLGNLYFSYQNKYPEYKRETIVDMMLDDGVIDFASADKIRKGVGLFDYYKVKKTDGDVNFTQIFGLQLSNDVNLNREIEPTKQPETQGDCWLLSDINALSYTEWGREVIREAIIPDEDGNGVTVRLKGSPLENKDIHITRERIIQARNSGNYADGDDDVIALELATEDTYREMVKRGMGTRIAPADDTLMWRGAKYRSYIWAGLQTEEFAQLPVSKLLGIDAFIFDKFFAEGMPNLDKYQDNILKYISQHQDSIAANCGFSFLMGGWGDENSKNYIHGRHAYAIKNIEYGKKVIITDPHYSDYDITVPWKVFVESLGNINISFKDSKTEADVMRLVPKDFNEKIKESRIQYKKDLEEMQNTIDAEEDSIRSTHKTEAEQ